MQTSKDDSIRVEFLKLRDLTKRTGGIYHAQVNQLKNWAAILSPVKNSFRIEVDSNAKTANFLFKKLNRKYTKHHPAALGRSVRWLLGDDWIITVVSEDKVIFKSRRLETLKTIEESEECEAWRDKLSSLASK